MIIKDGENYANLIIDLVDDSGLEPSETVILKTGLVTNNSYNTITVANSPMSLTIEDNDNASLTISKPVLISEGNSGITNAVFTVTLNNGTGDPFTIDYTTVDGTATVLDNDYIASTGTLTFTGKAGDFVNISVPVKGDLKIEEDEDFTVELSNLSNDFDGRLIINESASGLIKDDDNTLANKKITISKVDGAEGSRDASFKFSFPSGITADEFTTIPYVLTGTAICGGEDYSAPSTGSVVIPAGENSVILALPVVDDGVVENTETVILTAGVPVNDCYAGIAVINSPITLNITDNDKGELKLSKLSVVSEGNSGPTLASFSVTLTAATGSNFSVGYTTLDGTAKVNDNDYVAKTANINFKGTQGEVQTITILVNGDSKIESDEEFNLILRNLSNSFGGKLTFSGMPSTGRILNDDNGTLKQTVKKALPAAISPSVYLPEFIAISQ